MFRTTIGISFLALWGIAGVVAVPGNAVAQYDCPVAIVLNGKEILKARIIDVERPPTEQLWELLKSLSFSPDADGKDLPNQKPVEKKTIQGTVRVKIDGAGSVALRELKLVPNVRNTSAWVIDPDDVTRILKMKRSN